MPDPTDMAILCPQCGEIHFETSSGPPPTHCRKCESDLNGVAGYTPLLADVAADGETARPRTKTGTAYIVVGLVVLLAAGAMWWWGGVRFTQAKKTEATVVRAEAGSPKAGTAAPPPGKIRVGQTAEYKAGGRTYYQYPGVRHLGDKFSVYYLPGEPGDAQEEPPFAFLIAAAVLTKIGLFLLVRGIFRFSVARARESDYRRAMGAVSGVGR